MESSQSAIRVGLLILFLAVGVICGLYIVAALKRWMRRDVSIETFTLQELRELKERGELTAAEFEALRGELLARVGRDPAGAEDGRPRGKERGRDRESRGDALDGGEEP